MYIQNIQPQKRREQEKKASFLLVCTVSSSHHVCTYSAITLLLALWCAGVLQP